MRQPHEGLQWKSFLLFEMVVMLMGIASRYRARNDDHGWSKKIGTESPTPAVE